MPAAGLEGWLLIGNNLGNPTAGPPATADDMLAGGFLLFPARANFEGTEILPDSPHWDTAEVDGATSCFWLGCCLGGGYPPPLWDEIDKCLLISPLRPALLSRM